MVTLKSDTKSWNNYIIIIIIIKDIYIADFCLQCFDAVGWAAGRAPGL